MNVIFVIQSQRDLLIFNFHYLLLTSYILANRLLRRLLGCGTGSQYMQPFLIVTAWKKSEYIRIHYTFFHTPDFHVFIFIYEISIIRIKYIYIYVSECRKKLKINRSCCDWITKMKFLVAVFMTDRQYY